MEVVVQVAPPPPPPPPIDFNFDSSCSSPYISAPSSPQRLNNFFNVSSPPSPNGTRSSSFYKDLNDISFSTPNPFSSSSSTIPFNWEEKPGTPKAKSNRAEGNEGDFAFDFSGRLDRISLSAEELFDKGKIRPLKPPPGYDYFSQTSSPRSPSPRTPTNKSDSDFDPFQAALEETRKREVEQERGRERTSSKRKKVTSRSLSPLRVSDIIGSEPEESKPSYASSLFSSVSFSLKGHRKWKLKDLLLFRSASEGRASSSSSATRGIGNGNTDRSSGKYAVLSKKELIEDVKNSSFRSTEGSVSRRRISSAEAHYTANRAVLEEMRRKTPLPYKPGLLGCFFMRYKHFNPGVHDLSRGIGSLTRGR